MNRSARSTPINPRGLQDEFLRLQSEVNKTVVFVTHDIEEAVKLGDRIAILAEGGVLAQYSTPDRILSAPASQFVADFVGNDRGLKRLSVTPVKQVPLTEPPVLARTASSAAPHGRNPELRCGFRADRRGRLRDPRESRDGATAAAPRSPRTAP